MGAVGALMVGYSYINDKTTWTACGWVPFWLTISQHGVLQGSILAPYCFYSLFFLLFFLTKTGYAFFIHRYCCFMEFWHTIHMLIPFSKYKYKKCNILYIFKYNIKFLKLSYLIFLCTYNFIHLKCVFTFS